MKADNRYIPFLDGFRGIAILLVLLGHFNRDFLKVAQLGVTLFFFVSGFLITKLLINEFDKEKTIHLKEFYLRRLFRLYPALIFFLVVTCVQVMIMGYKIIYPDIFAGLFYFTNYYLVYFSPVLPDNGYPLAAKILWSLAVEEHFYLFFPFLFLWAYAKKGRLFIHLMWALLIAFLIARVLTFFSGTDITDIKREIYYTTHCRADSILYGCLSALLIYAYKSERYLKVLNNKGAFWIALAVLIVAQIIPGELFQNTVKYSITGIALAFVIPVFLFSPIGDWRMKILSNKPIVFVGRLSYSLYLFHWVALTTISFYFKEKGILWYSLVCSMTLVLSLISFYWIERPFLSLRRRFGSNAK